jgi:transposase
MDLEEAATVAKWLKRIEASELSVSEFFSTTAVPFSRRQYFNYKQRLQESGPAGLLDRRSRGGNRKVTQEQEGFLKGCIKRDPGVSASWLRQALVDEFGCDMTVSGMSRVLTRIDPNRAREIGRPPGPAKT